MHAQIPGPITIVPMVIAGRCHPRAFELRPWTQAVGGRRSDRQIAFADRTQPDSRRIGLFVHVIDNPLGIAVGDLLF